MQALRELLNHLRWDPRCGPEAVVLTVRSRERGAETAEEIALASVVEILPGGVTVAGGTFLPYHRVVSVRRGQEVLWRSSRG